MFGSSTKVELYATLTGVFTACLIISNVIAGKTFSFLSFTLPCGIIIFPVIYIVNDILSEVYGYKKTLRVILLGFVINLFAVLCYNITIWLPAPAYLENAGAYNIVLGSTLRLLIASFAAYLVGSIVNSRIMVYLKRVDEKKLFLRCVLSTALGESSDAMIFITLGFFGTMPFEILIGTIAVQAAFKTVYEIVIYPLTRHIIFYVKGLPD